MRVFEYDPLQLLFSLIHFPVTSRTLDKTIGSINISRIN